MEPSDRYREVRRWYARDRGHTTLEEFTALLEKTGFADLKSFAIHWERPTFRCLVKSYEQFPDVQNGVCLVEADAFQVRATALIVKRSRGLEVSILDWLVE